MGVEDWCSAPMYYCERKRKVKMGEAWEHGYVYSIQLHIGQLDNTAEVSNTQGMFHL